MALPRGLAAAVVAAVVAQTVVVIVSGVVGEDGSRGDVLLALLMFAPRGSSLWVLWLLGPGVGEWTQQAFHMCHLALSDSLLWMVPISYRIFMQVLGDVHLVLTIPTWLPGWRRQVTTLGVELGSLCAILLVIVLGHTMHPVCAKVASALVNIMLLWWAVHAASIPTRLCNAGRRRAASVCLTAMMLLVAFSENKALDSLGLYALCLAGFPLVVFRDSMWRWILQQFGVASRQNRRARVRIFIDRKRLFATSVEQLGRMGPAHLAEPPFVVFGGSAEDPAREDGVDFGGLRREWLGQLAGEFRLPERGLLEAPSGGDLRLRPGANLGHLEALGKALGLALRDGQPLGLELCPPLAHLLAHPALPEMLGRLSARSSVGDAALRHAEELRRIGFSRDWLRWVSKDEYRYLDSCLRGPEDLETRAEKLRVLGSSAEDGRPLTLEALPRHMERRALQVLVLDVAEEAKAVWRGLRAVPGVVFPPFEEEVRGSKRRASELDAEDAALDPGRAKRRRIEGPGSSTPRAAPQTAAGCTRDEGDPVEEMEFFSPISDDDIDVGGASGAASAARTPPQSILRDLLSGCQEISVAQWRARTFYTPAVALATPAGAQTVEWFWSYVEALSPAGRSALLEWITGYRHMPRGGFPRPFASMTIALVGGERGRMPCAHTCALQLNLSTAYGSQEELAMRLQEATANRQFHMQ